MSANVDQNAAIWQSEAGVAQYVSKQEAREAKRKAQWRLMGQILPYADDEAFTFCDIGAGTGAAARSILELFPAATAILADFSEQMMDEAKKAMAPFDGRYSFASFDMTTGDWPDAIPNDLSAIVTSQCVHHIPDERKAGLFHEIFEHLRPGGWYVNFDPIKPPNKVVGAAWDRAALRLDPATVEQEQHRTPEEERRHHNHVRYMIPLAPQLEMLERAGFAGIDIYYKHLDMVVYGGCKPA